MKVEVYKGTAHASCENNVKPMYIGTMLTNVIVEDGYLLIQDDDGFLHFIKVDRVRVPKAPVALKAAKK